MTAWLVEVDIPVVISPGRHFGHVPTTGEDCNGNELYVSGDDVLALLQKRPAWSDTARILTFKVYLGVSKPDGDYRTGPDDIHDLILNARTRFVVEDELPPPAEAFGAPWVLKGMWPVDL